MARASDGTKTHDVPLASGRAPRAPALTTGTVVGRYEILAPLASGGMADVWIGRRTSDAALSRLVAVKTVRGELADDSQFHEMFLREVRLASAIRHANVVEVLDVGEQDGTLFQVMSLIEGTTLSRLLKAHRGALPLGVACTILVDVLRGLHAAHEAVDSTGAPLGIVHRDVSPQNVLVGLDGTSLLSDFGIAKGLFLADEKTATGALRGKCGYFAPEQVLRRPIERRTDLFSAGIVLWEALTGRRLFRGEDLFETIDKIAHEPIPDPRTVNPDVPRAVAETCMIALAREPDDRFATTKDMASALSKAMTSVGISHDPEAVGRFVDAIAGDEIRGVIAMARARTGGATPRSGSAPARSRAPIEKGDATREGALSVDEVLAVSSEGVPSRADAPLPAPSAESRRSPVFVGLGVLFAALLVGLGAWLGRTHSGGELVVGGSGSSASPASTTAGSTSKTNDVAPSPSAAEATSLTTSAVPTGTGAIDAPAKSERHIGKTRPPQKHGTTPSLPVSQNPYR